MSDRLEMEPPRRASELDRLRRERMQMERERYAREGEDRRPRRAAPPRPRARTSAALRYRDRPQPADGSHLLGGGTEGNRRLTSQTGIVLLILLAVIGVTILRIGQLLSVHMFVGMLLIGPVALKLASTGYRFTRYYTSDRQYEKAGPPPTLLRMLAPIVVLSTVGVFATGVVLLLAGPSSRPTFLLLHKGFFILWIAVTAVHVLGHIGELPRALGARGRRWASLNETADRYIEATETIPGMQRPSVLEAEPALDGYGTGGAGRMIAISGMLVAGLVIALVSISWYGPWLHSYFH